MVIKKNLNGRIEISTNNDLYSIDESLVKFSLEYSRKQGESEEIIKKRCESLGIEYSNLR